MTGDEIAPAPMLIPGNLAALFFFTYESLKQAGSLIAPDHAHSAPLHILSASMAEVVHEHGRGSHSHPQIDFYYRAPARSACPLR